MQACWRSLLQKLIIATITNSDDMSQIRKMKNILLLLTALLMSSTAIAQTDSTAVSRKVAIEREKSKLDSTSEREQARPKVKKVAVAYRFCFKVK